MTRPSEDDRAAVDRAFAELVAGYHLTADRPLAPAGETPQARDDAPLERADPQPTVEGRAAELTTGPSAEGPGSGPPDTRWADEHPLFRFSEPAPEPAPPEPVEPRYVPDAMPPLAAPAVPALLGWIGIGWAALVVLAAAFGARFPSWVGWLAVLGFVGGFVILVTRLPRHRSPDAGDGAVL
jgi:hypothetical protein